MHGFHYHSIQPDISYRQGCGMRVLVSALNSPKPDALASMSAVSASKVAEDGIALAAAVKTKVWLD